MALDADAKTHGMRLFAGCNTGDQVKDRPKGKITTL